MITAPLTDGLIRSAEPGYYWDIEIPGLGIRICERGAKSFVVRRYEEGRRRIVTIGRYPILTLRKARLEAVAILSGSPHYSDVTVSQLSHEYLKRYARRRKRSWRDDELMLRCHVLPRLGSYKLKRLTAGAIEALFLNITERAPIAANRVLSLIKRMLGLAMEWGYLETNPAAKIKKNPETSRSTYITKAEMPGFLKVLEGEPLHFRAAILLLLMTGLRKSELLGLRWRDIHQGIIHIERTKNGQPHSIPLSSTAIKILEQLPRNGERLFPFFDFKKRWARVRRDAGLEHVVIHDLRRTLGSYLAQAGVSSLIIQEVLNHKDPRSMRVYTRFQKEHVRAAIEGVKF